MKEEDLGSVMRAMANLQRQLDARKHRISVDLAAKREELYASDLLLNDVKHRSPIQSPR